MELSPRDIGLLAALEDGLPLEPRPWAAVARAAGMAEDEAIERVRAMKAGGAIRRFGVIVRHRELGYRANAMVVWDVPDGRVGEAGGRLSALPFVTLCYRRPRRPPRWPYNLFCMIHGRDRAVVDGLVEEATRSGELDGLPRAVLYSRRRFRQRGARYGGGPGAATEAAE